MDRSLDEIAAEMRSPHELFEREYGEEGGDGVGPHRGHYHRSSAYRFSPYTTGHGPSWKSEMRRGEGEVASKRLFVANLSYAVTWQRLKDFMRQGICLLARAQTLISLGTRKVTKITFCLFFSQLARWINVIFSAILTDHRG